MEDIILMQEGDAPLASFIEKGLVAAWSAKGKNNTDTDRNILKDLSGQGHDITLYGFAYNDESGYSSKYPNALLFDGKETYGECTNMPIQTDYTIIAKRRYNINEKATGALISKDSTGGFIFEGYGLNHNCYSFSISQDIQISKEAISWQSKTSYNGTTIKAGTSKDTNKLYIGRYEPTDSSRTYNGAFYWAALFDKSLTTEEIDEFIKVMETPVGSKINICASKTLEECMEDTKFNLNTLYFPTDSDSIFFNSKKYCHHPGKIVDGGGEIFNDYENNTADGNNSHVEGSYNSTYGESSHAEGKNNTADGDNSHVEGVDNEVTGISSHVEGDGNICDANCSHVEGISNTATGNCSHVEGTSNISTIDNQHIEGQYSKESDSIHIVGIGTSGTSRKNAHEITLDGQHYIIGVGNYNGTNKESSTSLNAVVAGLDYYSIGDLTKLNENPTQENIITMLGLPNDIRNAIDKGIEIKVNGADNIQSKISAIGIIDAGNVIIKYAYPNQDNWTVIAKCVVDSSGTGWDNESFSIKIDKGGSGSGIDIVQSTGNSQTAVMSQKAVTEALIKIGEINNIDDESVLDSYNTDGIYNVFLGTDLDGYANGDYSLIRLTVKTVKDKVIQIREDIMKEGGYYGFLSKIREQTLYHGEMTWGEWTDLRIFNQHQ